MRYRDAIAAVKRRKAEAVGFVSYDSASPAKEKKSGYADQWVSMPLEDAPGAVNKSTVQTIAEYRDQVGAWMQYPPPFPPEHLPSNVRGEAYDLWWDAVERLHKWGLVPESTDETVKTFEGAA